MIPLRSSEPHYTRPTVTLLIIAVNVAVFSVPAQPGPSYTQEPVHHALGMVPDRFTYSSIMTSMFIHGGLPAHRRQHVVPVDFWPRRGGPARPRKISAALLRLRNCRRFLFILLNSNSTVPTVGASGAIAGVMGAYLIKFPRAHIVTLVFIVIFITTVDIPAVFLLLYWFAIQFFSGVGSVGYSQMSRATWRGSRTWADLSPACCWSCVMPGRAARPRPWRY